MEDTGTALVVRVTPVLGEDNGLVLHTAGARAGLLRSTLELGVEFSEPQRQGGC